MHAGIVLFLAKVNSGYMDSAFALDETDHLGNGVLWWNRYQYMNMIRLQAPFKSLAFFLPGKTVEQVGKMLPYSTKQYVAAIFGDPYNMILAIPFRVI